MEVVEVVQQDSLVIIRVEQAIETMIQFKVVAV